MCTLNLHQVYTFAERVYTAFTPRFTPFSATQHKTNMAIFKITVRKKRSDGFYPVYIRVTHNKKVSYIKTDKLTTDKYLSASGEVTDPYVLEPLSRRVREYGEYLNRYEIRSWTVQQVVAILAEMDEDLSFSDYARKHIDRMIDRGQVRNSQTYKHALQSMELSFGTNQIKFSQLTSARINKWIGEMAALRRRCKEQYPVCMRQVFKAALLELNDEEAGIVRVKFNPWLKVQIPKSDTPDKKAVPAEDIRRFFAAPLPESKMISPLPELGRDVAMLILCLGGINTADLYDMRKTDYHHGIIHYRRHKTRNSRKDGAYFEMRVPEMLLPIFEKYATADGDEYLFTFHERYCDDKSFLANVNSGIKKICKELNIPEEDRYSSYTFRHTWATTAQNDIGVSFSELGFAMNHSQHHAVTRGYVKIDFSKAWELNEKVIDFILFSDKPSKLATRTEDDKKDDEEPEGTLFRISAKKLVKGEAFYQGKCVAKFEDMGLGTVDAVIARLVPLLPDNIPARAIVQFKITNRDNGRTAYYERQKGKGF